MENNPSNRPPLPENNLVWAILSTVFCCLPFGIVSIVYAAKVNTLYFTGEYQRALQAAENAKKWAIISAVSVVAVLFLYFIVAVLFELMS